MTMPRAAARFTQAEIARALRAIEQEQARAAIEVLPNGTIRIVQITEAEQQAPIERAKPSHAREIVL
jgi:hypothetical protein